MIFFLIIFYIQTLKKKKKLKLIPKHALIKKDWKVRGRIPCAEKQGKGPIGVNPGLRVTLTYFNKLPTVDLELSVLFFSFHFFSLILINTLFFFFLLFIVFLFKF
jgi:hypothetical protein